MKTQDMTLGEYAQRKVWMSVSELALKIGLPERTLYNKWNSVRGRMHVEDAVFRIYVERFKDL